MKAFLEEQVKGHRHELELWQREEAATAARLDECRRQILLRSGHVAQAEATLAEFVRLEKAAETAASRADTAESLEEPPPVVPA